MVNTLPMPQNLVTNTWVKTSWEEFLALVDSPELEKARLYYDNGYMRIETMPIGSGHGRDNTLLSQTVSLYGTLKNIRIVGFTNASFRKQGMRECQPDMAFISEQISRFHPKLQTRSM